MLDLNHLKSKKSLLDDRYQLKERIGGGGFSDVWLAHDTCSRVDVVLKVYASSQTLDEEGIKMFRKEFTLICNLNHTNILKPFTFYITNGTPYIVLPYCEQGSASKMIGKMSESELLDFTKQVAEGLAHLHRHKIIHQDIKPANILLNADKQYMITDFGISTNLRNTIRMSQKKDEDPGSGTTAYMSHECFGINPINVIARDIWALGATLYELATGEVPFGEYGGITQKSMKGKVPEIEGTAYSDEFKNLIYKCLALNPWKRPSADEIIDIIKDILKGSPTPHWLNRKIAVAISSLVLLSGIWWKFSVNSAEKDINHIVKVNPFDSVFIAKVTEANDIVELEKNKGNLMAVDEKKLCEAVQIYSEAMKLNATDSIKRQGESMWNASQMLIDKTYTFLDSESKRYREMEAMDAANTFKSRSEALKDLVSKELQSSVKKRNAVKTSKREAPKVKIGEKITPSMVTSSKELEHSKLTKNR